MNNSFGSNSGIIFSTAGITQSAVSGSLLSFKLKKSAEKKEITDGSDNFAYVGVTKRKKVANVEVLFTGSGSALIIPDIGDTATITNPSSGDSTGSWGVTDAEVNWKSEDACKVSYEITQWYKTGGATLP